MSDRKIRVSILLDSLNIAAWKFELLRTIRMSQYAEIASVIIATSDSRDSDPLNKFPKGLLKSFLHFEKRKFRPKPDAFEIRSTVDLFKNSPILRSPQLSDGSLPPDALASIRNSVPEVIVALGSLPPSGEILTIPAHGVWSYETPALAFDEYLSGGLGEFLSKEPATVNAVYRLRGSESEHEILTSSVSPADPMSYLIGRSRRFWKLAHLVPRLLSILAQFGEPGLKTHAARRNPFLLQRRETVPPRAIILRLLRHMLGLGWKKVRRHFVFDQWILMYGLDRHQADLNSFKMMLPPRNTVWADPFVVFRDSLYYIFFEECPLKPKKGRISVIVMDEAGKYTEPTRIIDRPYHLSYPFIFEWEGNLYLIPESSENKSVELYKCRSFPFDWEFQKNLIPDHEIVDSTLLHRNGRWWLFASMRENDGYPNWDELYLFHADTPISDQWIPHPMNPVISDVTRARPAGRIIEVSGECYRPSQDCSRRYGYGTRINRIITLSETEYLEEEVGFIEPTWSNKLSGVHTLARNGQLTVIDALYRRSAKR